MACTHATKHTGEYSMTDTPENTAHPLEQDELLRMTLPDDVLKVRIMDTLDGTVSMDQVTMLQVRMGSSNGLDSVGALKRRIAEFIHAYGLQNKAVRPISISRRFNTVASGLGVRVQDLLEDLLARGTISWLVYGSKRFVASRAILNAVKAQQELMGKVDMAKYEDGIVSNAF